MPHLLRMTALPWLMLAFAFMAQPAYSQQPAARNDTTIQQALADLTPPAGAAAKPLPFPRLVAVAIALEQTRGWKSTAADRLRQSLPDAPGKQYFAALQQLLADGDPAGAIALRNQVRAGALPATEVLAAIAALRQAGLTLAADALIAVQSDVPQEVIAALLRIPETKRPPLDTFLYDRNNPANSPLNYMKLASTAVRMYGETPLTEQATCDGLLRFLLLFGFGGNQFNSLTARHLAEQGKVPHALFLQQWLLTRFPDDTTLQADTLQAVRGMNGTRQDQVGMQVWMADTLKPHYGRGIRQVLLREIAFNPKYAENISIEALRGHADPLIAAESALALKDYTAASKGYAGVLANKKDPLPRRLAAWSGLWDAEPDQAVAAIPALTDEILQLPAGTERTALIRWFGGEMGRVATMITNGYPGTRKATAPACYVTMAASLATLLQADPVACLRTENQSGPSLRYAATLIFTLVKRGKEANAVAAQTVEYQEFPRPGTRFAPTTAKLREAMDITAPRLGETEELMKQVTETLVRYDVSFGKNRTTMMTPEPPNTSIIAAQCARIAVTTNATQIQLEMRSMGMQLAYVVTYLDPKRENLLLNQPPPPAREVNMEYFAPIRAAILAAMAHPLAAQNAEFLISEGFQPAMLTASNPELLNAIFDLSVEVLDQCVAAKKGDAILGPIRNYATTIGGRQIWDLTPYMTRLQERYLKKAEK